MPSVTHSMSVWGSCGQVLFSQLESIHVRAAKIIFNLDWCAPSKEVLATAKWNTLETMYEKRLLILAHQAYYHFLPCPMSCLFVKYENKYDFRRKMTFKLPRSETDMLIWSRKHAIQVNYSVECPGKPNEINLWHWRFKKRHSGILVSHVYWH